MGGGQRPLRPLASQNPIMDIKANFLMFQNFEIFDKNSRASYFSKDFFFNFKEFFHLPWIYFKYSARQKDMSRHVFASVYITFSIFSEKKCTSVRPLFPSTLSVHFVRPLCPYTLSIKLDSQNSKLVIKSRRRLPPSLQ